LLTLEDSFSGQFASTIPKTHRPKAVSNFSAIFVTFFLDGCVFAATFQQFDVRKFLLFICFGVKLQH